MAKILIVEDDKDIGKILEDELSKAGHETIWAKSGTEGRLALNTHPDLILMDLMLPGMTGEELLTHIDKDTPVIAVSAKSSVDDKVNLLTSGCVDYITKPFNVKELLARVEVALRKVPGQNPVSTYSAGDLRLDDNNRKVTAGDKEIHLTRTEYAILKILLQNKERVISKSELLDLIKSDTPDCMESSLKVHITNLRRKLKEAGGKDYIEAVWGIGFKMADLQG